MRVITLIGSNQILVAHEWDSKNHPNILINLQLRYLSDLLSKDSNAKTGVNFV